MRRRLGVEQQLGETQCVLGQERGYWVLRVAAVVALVEQQIERSQDGVRLGVDVRQVVHVGQPAQLTQPAVTPMEPLVDGLGVDEERLADLLG